MASLYWPELFTAMVDLLLLILQHHRQQLRQCPLTVSLKITIPDVCANLLLSHGRDQ